MTVGGEGRRGYPEDFLLENPGDEGLGDGFVEGAHPFRGLSRRMLEVETGGRKVGFAEVN